MTCFVYTGIIYALLLDHYLLHISITVQQLVIITALCVVNLAVACQKVVNEEKPTVDDNFHKLDKEDKA